MNKLYAKSRIKKPIFVIGCSNSGTTILWDAIKSHKGISGPSIEGQDLSGMPKEMVHWLGNTTFRLWAHHIFSQGEEETPGSNLFYYVNEKNWTSELVSRIEEVYLCHIKPGTRLCDKSPAHTLRARFLQACFPDAYFIGIVRDPYASAEGIRRKRLYDLDRPKFKGLITTIGDAAEQWHNANRVIKSYGELNLLERLLVVKYEDLVRNPETTLHKVFDFCQLEKQEFPIPSFDKNRNYEQTDKLSIPELFEIKKIAKPMIKFWGYNTFFPFLEALDRSRLYE